MSKRFSVLYLVLLIAIFISDRTFCLADEEAAINKQKENIYLLVDAGKFSEAKAATEKMTADFPGSAKLPEMLYWISGRFQALDRFEDAKQICEQIIRDFPDSPWAKRAKMGNAMTEAMSLIMSGKYAEAKAVTDKMASDFAGEPDLPEMLYWITERFQRVDRFEDAKQLYQNIIHSFPDSLWAEKANFFIARVNAISLLVSGDYNEGKKAIDKLFIDFAGSPDLPEALYWITDRYERVDKCGDAINNYQRISQNFPNSSWANRARIGIARANLISLIVSKSFSAAKQETVNFCEKFKGNPDLPGSLFWMTERYEKAGEFYEALDIYKKIVQNYPDSPYAKKARLGVRRVEVMALMTLHDFNQAENALNKMIADFKNDPELPVAVAIIGEKCFTDAKTPDYCQRTIKVLEKVIYEIPHTQEMAGMNAEVYCCAGDCYSKIGDYTKAIESYDKVTVDYNGHRLTGHAYFGIGQTYEKLINSGNINESEAVLKIKNAYEQLVQEYPNNQPYVETARKWLNEHNPK